MMYKSRRQSSLDKFDIVSHKHLMMYKSRRHSLINDASSKLSLDTNKYYVSNTSYDVKE